MYELFMFYFLYLYKTQYEMRLVSYERNFINFLVTYYIKRKLNKRITIKSFLRILFLSRQSDLYIISSDKISFLHCRKVYLSDSTLLQAFPLQVFASLSPFVNFGLMIRKKLLLVLLSFILKFFCTNR